MTAASPDRAAGSSGSGAKGKLRERPLLDGVAWAMLGIAAAVLVAHLVCRATGLREYVTVLCGTLPEGASDWAAATALGGIYAASYFAAVLVAPALVLAVALYSVIVRLVEKRRPAPDPPVC